MADRTKIDLAGYITISEELRRKYGLHPKSLVDIISAEEGLRVRKTAILDGRPDAPSATGNGQTSLLPVPDAVKKLPHEGVKYSQNSDTLTLDNGLIIEQAAEKLRRVLYPMLRYLNELDEKSPVYAPQPVLEDIIRISEYGQIKVARDFRRLYGLHPNAEVEITDDEDSLLVRKVGNSENPVDQAYGSIPPGGIVAHLDDGDASS